MKCPRCRVEVKNSRYCSNCGADLTEKKELNKFANRNYSSERIDTSNDELLTAFIGPNAHIIKKRQFSLPALIFGPFYLLTRKLYNWGFLLLFLESSVGGLKFSLVFWFIRICLAFYFNKIYIMEANKRIEAIKNENPNASYQGLINLVKNRGGISWALPITIFIIYFLIILAFILMMFGLIEGDFIEEEDYTTEKTRLYYNVPEGFKEEKSTTTSLKYVTEDRKCAFTVSKIKNSNENNAIIEEITSKYLEENYKDRFIEINDYLWNESMEMNQIEKIYNLKTSTESTTYNIEFELSLDEEHIYCEDSYNYLKDSLEVE